ncbi:MAG: acyltransferase family protein [Planctomycetaceae bacterium]|nr:acyltransferase family protein [Planctomycetaceae bacterium]
MNKASGAAHVAQSTSAGTGLYLPSLDGFRGIAILLVMVYHADWLRGGYLGVDLFFVLSGYLITRILLHEHSQTGSIGLLRFYGRRGLRLLPTLLLVVGAVWVYAHHLEPSQANTVTAREVWAILLYYVNLPQAFQWFPVGVLRHCWSLAIEEHFYLVWPPVLAIALRLGLSLRACLVWVLVLVFAVVSWRYWLTDSGVLYRRIYFSTDTRADGLLLGCATAFVGHMGRLPRGRTALILFLLGGAVFAGMVALGSTDTLRKTVIWMGLGGFFASSLGAACLIPYLADGGAKCSWLRSGLENRALVWVGKLSYALYLIHLPVFVYGMRHLERSGRDVDDPAAFAVGRAVQFAISFALAALVYHGLEAPLANLRRRLRRA